MHIRRNFSKSENIIHITDSWKRKNKTLIFFTIFKIFERMHIA